jgi:hypothetical protein
VVNSKNSEEEGIQYTHMEPQYTQPQDEGEQVQATKWYTPLTTVTSVSKILAGLIFIAMPFIGFWWGMQYENEVGPQIIESVVYIPDQSSDDEALVDETTEWQTYKNTQYGLEFKSRSFRGRRH